MRPGLWWRGCERPGHDEAMGAYSDAFSHAAFARLGPCRPDVRSPSRLLPASIRDEIRGILCTRSLS